MATPRTAFLSYSHDNPAHTRRVAALAHDLRRDGVECLCDQYVLGSPPEGWPLWMERALEEADYIVVVCSPTYLRRVRKEEQPGRGLGATYEAHLIYQLLYEQQTRNDRFLPVLFDPADQGSIPLPLRSISHYLIDSPAGYEALLRRILEVPAHDVPLVGTPPNLPVEPSPTLFPRPGQPRFRSNLVERPPARTLGLWASAAALAAAVAILIVLLKKGQGAGPAIAQTVDAGPTGGLDGATPHSAAVGQRPPPAQEIIDDRGVDLAAKAHKKTHKKTTHASWADKKLEWEPDDHPTE